MVYVFLEGLSVSWQPGVATIDLRQINTCAKENYFEI